MRSQLTNRLKKIERTLNPDNKDEWLKFPCPDGSFIEVPGCRSLVDVMALTSDRTRQEPQEQQ